MTSRRLCLGLALAHQRARVNAGLAIANQRRLELARHPVMPWADRTVARHVMAPWERWLSGAFVAVIAAILLFLSGCSGPPSNATLYVDDSLTPAQVTAILEGPDQWAQSDGASMRYVSHADAITFAGSTRGAFGPSDVAVWVKATADDTELCPPTAHVNQALASYTVNEWLHSSYTCFEVGE